MRPPSMTMAASDSKRMARSSPTSNGSAVYVRLAPRMTVCGTIVFRKPRLWCQASCRPEATGRSYGVADRPPVIPIVIVAALSAGAFVGFRSLGADSQERNRLEANLGRLFLAEKEH